MPTPLTRLPLDITHPALFSRSDCPDRQYQARLRCRFNIAAGGLCVSAAQKRADEYVDSASTS
jgi:hypothetical protein